MLKKIFFWFAFFLLNTALVLALVVTPVSTHLTNRESVKSWVSSPEILGGVSEIIPTLLSEAFEDEDGVGVSQISDEVIGVDLNQLAEAAGDVLTPDYMTEKLHPVIDGLYDWLEGETESPQFEVVLSDRITALADAVSGPLKSELAMLPQCPSNLQYSEDFNPIEAFCVPLGTDVESIVDEFTEQLTASDDIADISISSDDIEFDEDVLTLAPQVYSGISSLPYVFIGAVLLLSVALVLLAKSYGRGLNTLSWTFIGSGAVTAISFWILGKTDLFVNINSGGQGGEVDELVTEHIVEPLVKVVLGDIARTGLMISLFVVALGVIILLGNYTHHKITHEQKEETPKKPKPAKKTKADDDVPTGRQEARYINKISKKK